jgi:hypothetical protein
MQRDELPATMFRTSDFDDSPVDDLIPTRFVPVDDDGW